MTPAEFIFLIAVVAYLALMEIQLIRLKKDLETEKTMRRSIDRVMQLRIVDLWEDIRAAGIKRAQKGEKAENDKSGSN